MLQIRLLLSQDRIGMPLPNVRRCWRFKKLCASGYIFMMCQLANSGQSLLCLSRLTGTRRLVMRCSSVFGTFQICSRPGAPGRVPVSPLTTRCRACHVPADSAGLRRGPMRTVGMRYYGCSGVWGFYRVQVTCLAGARNTQVSSLVYM